MKTGADVPGQAERAQEKFICPRRSEVGSGPFKMPENDSWDIQGKDLTCTFCGSWHPDEFMEFVRNGEGRLFPSATEGAIKFYSPHHRPETLHRDVHEVVSRLMKDKVDIH